MKRGRVWGAAALSWFLPSCSCTPPALSPLVFSGFVMYSTYSGVLQCVYDGNFTRDGMRYVGSDVWSDLLLFGVVEFRAIEIQRSQQ